MILQKMKLQEIHPEHVESWAHFWGICPAGQFVLGTAASPFKLPRAQVDLTNLVIQKKKRIVWMMEIEMLVSLHTLIFANLITKKALKF